MNGEKSNSQYSHKVIEKGYDRELINRIIEFGGGNVQTCFQCGTCTGVCPVSLRVEDKIRNIVKMCQMGLKEKVLSTSWFCSTCYRCYELCPSLMNPTEMMIALRHIMVRELGPPQFVVTFSQSIAFQGQMPQITPGIAKMREGLGLRPESLDERFKGKVVEEIRTIMKATGFDRLVGIALGE